MFSLYVQLNGLLKDSEFVLVRCGGDITATTVGIKAADQPQRFETFPVWNVMACRLRTMFGSWIERKVMNVNRLLFSLTFVPVRN